jgi:hypothetical protein
MIPKILRIISAINLAAFLVLFVRLGSPLPHFRNSALANFIQDWWITSTAAVLILFMVRIAQRVRSKQPGRFWLDATLTATWIVAVGIIILVGATQFGGFQFRLEAVGVDRLEA